MNSRLTYESEVLLFGVLASIVLPLLADGARRVHALSLLIELRLSVYDR